MKVFIAGATGALGVPLLRELVARGHEVVGLTRSPEKRALIEQLGASAAVADALDPPALERALLAAAPTHVVHLLTALPKNGPMRPSDIATTNRLRVQGTANLLRAAIAAGAQRIIGESFTGIYGFQDRGDRPLDEDAAPDQTERDPGLRAAIEALRSLEDQLLEANRSGKIEAIVLRYGLTYGPENASTKYLLGILRKRRLPLLRGAQGRVSFIHIDDAATATIAALEQGLPGAIYNIVDDQPVGFNEYLGAAAQAIGARRPWALPAWLLRLAAPMAAKMMESRLPLSNARAKQDLGWRPHYPSYREGLRQVAQRIHV
jgi:2-alkyl-3-oxoalkanoate reductase